MKENQTPWTKSERIAPLRPAGPNQQAKQLAGVTLFFASSFLFAVFILDFASFTDQWPLLLGWLLILVFGVTAVVLHHKNLLYFSTLFVISFFDLAILCTILLHPVANLLLAVFLIIPVLIASMFTDRKSAWTVALLNFLPLSIMFGLFPKSSRGEIVIVGVFYVTSVILILLTERLRNDAESERSAQLLASETRLRSYFQEANDWIFTLDKNGRFSSVNAKVSQTTGLPESAFLGKHPADFLTADDQRRVSESVAKILRREDVNYLEIQVPNANGRPIWLEVRGRILQENDQVIGTIHIARDITERKLAAEAQNKLYWETTVLYKASQQLGLSLNFAHIHEAIYNIVASVVDCSLLILSRYNPADNNFHCTYVRQYDRIIDVSSFAPYSTRLDNDNPRTQALISGKLSLIEGETAVAQTLPLNTKMTELTQILDPALSLRAVVLAPLHLENQIYGLLQVYTSRIEALSESVQSNNPSLWEAVIQQISAALTNAHLFDETQKRRIEAETLRQAAATLNSSLSLNVVLTRILEQLKTAIPYDSATVQQKEGDRLVIRAAQGFPDNAGLINLNFAITADLPNAEALRTLSPLALPNVRLAYPYFRKLAHQYQADRIISWLGIPMVVSETILGMLTIDRNEERPFSDEEIALGVAFANHASIALRNANIFQELENHSDLLEQAVAARTAELEHTTTQVEAILNNSPAAILLLDPQNNIERVNPSFEALFGYQAAEIKGRPPFDLITPESRPYFIAACQTAVSHGSQQRLEITAQHKNNSLLDLNVALAPFNAGDNPAIVCSLHDISAFKEIDRLKDDFVSNVSHELRTPIANLKLHHDLIKLNPAKQDTYLERQGREIDRLTIIIESLLRLSRLDQRRIEINPTPVNLLTLAQQFVSDRNTQAEKHQLKLQIIDSSSLPLVKADEKLIGQVIGIILTNAITYTPPGGSVILKGKTRQKNEQLWVGLSITDTGPGIPADELDKIFARFYRGSSGRLSGAPGTGLGLAIAKEIMALHLGTIEAASLGLNMGSTFTIWLPAMSVAKDEPAQV